MASVVALVGVLLFAIFERAGQSQPATAALAASSLATAPGTAKIAFLTALPKAWPTGISFETELYLMNPDGTGKRRLLRAPAPEPQSGKGLTLEAPVWSPDGLELAFTRDSQVYVVGADGSEQHRLTTNGGGVAAWSPDGKMIAFSHDDGVIPNLYVMQADGSGLQAVTPKGVHAYGASWSPDGRRIVFGSIVGGIGNDRDGDVFVVNVDGSGLANLTGNPAMDHSATWSPDGRTIAFVSYRGDPRHAALYVMNADGSEPRRLTPAFHRDSSYSWSPDGRRIAFVSDRDGNDEVYVVDVDGTGLRNLTRNPWRDGHPVWSPDGRKIGFVSNRGGNRDIYVMNADGSGQRNLTPSIHRRAFGIAWMPALPRAKP